MQWFCCALLCCGYMATSCVVVHLPIFLIFFGVASLALGQSYDCTIASEISLKNMGKLILISNQCNRALKCVLFLRYTILQKRKQAPGLMQYPTLLSNALQLQKGYQWGHLRLIVGKEYCTDWDATNAVVSYYNIVNVPWKQWFCYRIGDFLQNPHNRNTTVHLLW